MAHKRGYDTPLVPTFIFAYWLLKLRQELPKKFVNPKLCRRKFQEIACTKERYKGNWCVAKRFYTVEICKEEGTAMRIGTNHGSLSDRILNR